MSNLIPYDAPHISSLQCYICVYNKACELQKQQQLSIAEIEIETEKQPEFPTANVQCKGCKLQHYCSLQHLIEDQEHREFCSVLTELQKSLNLEHPLQLNDKISIWNVQATKSQLTLALRVKLKRQLTRRERELLGYPAYCVVCYRLDELTSCKDCFAVAYCSEEHCSWDRKNHTKEVCQTLALYYSPYRMLESKLEVQRFLLSSNLQCHDLSKAFQLATGIRVNSQPWLSIDDYERFATCSSFSGIASICLALTHISFVAPPHKTLSIYVVGAKEQQLRYFQEMHIKFFFLHYQTVCQLEICFIGAQMQETEKEEYKIYFLGHRRSIVKRTYSMNFERFAKLHRVDPTLIMIYNPDFGALDKVTERLVERRYPQSVLSINEYDWRCCLLETIVTYGVPICFTSPTKMQSRSDIACINAIARDRRIAVKTIYNCRENPYREILPYHNHSTDDTETIIYNNNYLEVIFTTKQG